MEKINQKEQELINDIEVVNAETCGNATGVCAPEDMFDVIEQCKICGRCV